MKRVIAVGLAISTVAICRIGLNKLRNRILQDVLDEMSAKNTGGVSNHTRYKLATFDTRIEAEQILTNLVQLIEEYGSATLSDLYDMLGDTRGNFADTKYGWINLSKAVILFKNNKYTISLPEAVLLS